MVADRSFEYLVSGHDFSHAVRWKQTTGFSPESRSKCSYSDCDCAAAASRDSRRPGKRSRQRREHRPFPCSRIPACCPSREPPASGSPRPSLRRSAQLVNSPIPAVKQHECHHQRHDNSSQPLQHLEPPALQRLRPILRDAIPPIRRRRFAFAPSSQIWSPSIPQFFAAE